MEMDTPLGEATLEQIAQELGRRKLISSFVLAVIFSKHERYASSVLKGGSPYECLGAATFACDLIAETMLGNTVELDDEGDEKGEV